MWLRHIHRPKDYLSLYIVKAGRSLIRQRAELKDAATGKLLATGSGSWMPL